ncbi:FIST C-terminal domain-containing protein [Synergistaceae bacterium OttesenSCG-928-I11]|nr:FIST C-terminal domain-containing protein [Synergistaceae bacterium OttesenSCG-928-I11]
MKSRVGSSVKADARAAGIEAASRAKEGLSDIKLALVYASVAYDLPAMLDGVKSELPGVPLVGNTSFTGVVTPEGFASGESGFVGVMLLAGDDLVVGVAGLAKSASARETGKQVAREAMKRAGRTDAPTYFYMAAPPGEEEFFLKGVTDVIGRVPFFGGSAADNAIAGEWSLYEGTNVFADGVTVAFFYTKEPMCNLYTGAYRETSDVGIITKIEGHRTLKEIDGRPAVEVYASWTGVSPDSLKGGALLAATITSPLGVKDRLGELVAIRHPMNGNDDLSMAIGSNLAEKTAVIRMEASVDELIASASETLESLKKKCGFKPAAFHLVHCGGRRAGIGDRIGEVVDAVKKSAGDVPFIMEFTFGEYGFEDDGNNTMGGLMLSYTALR